MKIGDRFHAGNDLTLQAWDNYADQSFSPCLTIGNDVTLTDQIQISCAYHIEIGNHVLIGKNVADIALTNMVIIIIDHPPDS